MKIKHFWQYVLWQGFKLLLIAVTSPVWVPVGAVIFVLAGIAIACQDTYESMQHQWARKQEREQTP